MKVRKIIMPPHEKREALSAIYRRMPSLKKPKRKLSYRKGLIKDLDTEMSKYVRKRDGKCVICGATERLTNGHLFSRQNYSTRWDEENCNCQCTACNFKHELDTYPYTRWFLTRFGVDKYDALYRKHRLTIKWSNDMLEKRLEELKILNTKLVILPY